MTETKVMTARELITKYYEGDGNDWLSLMDDNVVVDEWLSGRVEGIDNLRFVAEETKKGYCKWVVNLQHMVVDGNQVCTGTKLEAVTVAGEPINVTVASLFQVKNGKIISVTNFHDTIPFRPDTSFRSYRAMRGLAY